MHILDYNSFLSMLNIDINTITEPLIKKEREITAEMIKLDNKNSAAGTRKRSSNR